MSEIEFLWRVTIGNVVTMALIVATFLVLGAMLHANAKVIAAMTRALEHLSNKVRCSEDKAKP